MAIGPAASRPRKAVSPPKELNIQVEPRGPSPDVLFRSVRAAMMTPKAKTLLRRARHRVLGVELLEPQTEVKERKAGLAPRVFRATIYDYSKNRTVFVEGRLDGRRSVQAWDLGIQPLPVHEEFEEAVRILKRHSQLSPLVRDMRLRPYAAMPPLVRKEGPDGTVERELAVGLLPAGSGVHHEIVGVNLVRRNVERFPNRAPPRSVAHNPICGLPNAFQPTDWGVTGQAWVSVYYGGQRVWRFLAVRPAASSGTNGSGVELRYVDYRGKRVLYRAHAPILNVKYDNDACGPYRDWLDQEGMIQAVGTDVAPGFRLCSSPAQTILDSGSDQGNYLGTAIYVQGLEVVLVSETQAGWYRYISEWRLNVDGTIRPRFGFSAVQNSCVCSRHYHHVYWRLDFDIRTAGGNFVREYNKPPIIGSSNWHTKYYELRRPRDPARNRRWRVANSVTGEAYDIVPGTSDGLAASSADWPFSRGDVWILRYHGLEIDDGSVATGPPYEAGIDQFLNGESVYNQDVVLWYAGHFTHDTTTEGTTGHEIGPTLQPVGW